MIYEAIDDQIKTWVKIHGVKLFTKFAGAEVRFFYSSSLRGECFQISIQPPKNNKIIIDAWSVDTIDDEDFHERWTTSVMDLTMALNAAMERVNQWMSRARGA